MNKKCRLKRYIDALDFAIYELILFLDTHPNDRKAQASFNEYKERRRAAISEYEEAFGPYVTKAIKSNPQGKWEWIKGPWPWENGGDE